MPDCLNGRGTGKTIGKTEEAGHMKDSVDYLKYVTEKMLAHWEQRARHPEARLERRRKREPWVTRWFGQLLPLGVVLWLHHRKRHAARGNPSDAGIMGNIRITGKNGPGTSNFQSE
jgi:hypothetical protein